VDVIWLTNGRINVYIAGTISRVPSVCDLSIDYAHIANRSFGANRIVAGSVRTDEERT